VSDVERTRSIIERWIGAAAVAVLALACLLILRPFISAALWPAILCFTTWPLFTRLKAKLGIQPYREALGKEVNGLRLGFLQEGFTHQGAQEDGTPPCARPLFAVKIPRLGSSFSAKTSASGFFRLKSSAASTRLLPTNRTNTGKRILRLR
jgi:hypothetical protein